MSRRGLVAAALALVCFAFYLSNVRVMGQWDSVPARLLPFSVLLEGDVDLDEFTWLAPQRSKPPYFMRFSPDHRAISGYPIATPLLVTPLYVPAAVWVARARPDLDDVRFRLLAMVMERIGAAALAALSVALVFLAACTLTGEGTAAGVALVYGLGTSVWCVSSQALWQHGAAQMALAGLSLGLMRAPSTRTTILAGCFAALALAVRPTLALFVAAAALVVALERRRDLLVFAAVAALGAGAVAAYNLSLLGLVGGGYQSGSGGVFQFPTWDAFAGLWISPNRGLLIYTPIVLLALAHPLVRRPETSRWLDVSLLATLAYSVFFSSFRYWWAGYNFGPRYMIDPLPLLALAAVEPVERLLRLRLGRTAIAALALWGVGVQVLGVYFDGDDWNSRPANVNHSSDRLWDWRDNQILRTAGERWHGSDLWPLLRQSWNGSTPAYLRRLAAADLAAEAAIVGAPPELRAQSEAAVRVDLVNRGQLVWPALKDWGGSQVWVAYRWISLDLTPRRDRRGIGSGPPWSEAQTLPRNLEPGAPLRLELLVETPPTPGRYRLELAAAQGVKRGALHGGSPASLGELEVLPANP